MIRKAFNLIVCILLAFLISACKEEVGTLGLPINPTDKSYSLTFTDTTTVYASTVLLDSIPTSNTGLFLIGQYTDAKLGVVKTSPYFQITLNNGVAWVPADDIVFDSLMLIMNYSGYYYGDTTQAQTFEIKPLNDDFRTYSIPEYFLPPRGSSSQGYYSSLYSAGALFNNSKVSIDEASTLGTFTLTPRPQSKDSIRVRLDDNVGKQWLNDAHIPVNGPFSSTYYFSQYFKGITIRSITPNASYVVGLVTPNKLKVRLFYHQFQNGLAAQAHVDFPFVTASSGSLYNFNKISSDLATTDLKDLNHTHNEIVSSVTSEETYVQSGVGILTKLKFPHLRRLLDAPGFTRLTSARLIVEPITNSYEPTHRLPARLKLFYTNTSNFPLGSVAADFSNSPLESTLITNNGVNSNPAYIFSIYTYVQSILSTIGNSENEALFLSTSIDDLESTVNRVILGSGQRSDFRIRVEVYYLKQNL